MKKCRKLLVLLLSIALLVGTAAVGAGALTNEKHWVGSWSAGMTDISVSLLEGKKNTEGLSISPFVKNMTARIRLTPTLGGNKVRFCLSNENGSSPLVIDQASIARAKGDSGAEIVSGSSIPVTFNGSRKVAIRQGALSIVTQWIWRCARGGSVRYLLCAGFWHGADDGPVWRDDLSGFW